jgi:diguanylate cyclase (GGDEF)-like protein
VVLPGCGADTSLSLAERLRCCVEAEAVGADSRVIPLTISMGVAVWDREASAQQLLEAADGALYRAKAEGRNRSVTAEIAPAQP